MARDDRYIGQTYGPAGMGMNAYMNRPEQQQGIPPSRRFKGIPPSRRFNQGIPSPGRRKFENYLKRGLEQGIGSLGPNIGRDRHPMARGMEQAAVDPSDWRTLEAILGAGGNPDDYVQTAMGPDDDYPMFPSGPGIRGPRYQYDPEVQEIDLFDMMEDDTFLPDFDQDEYYDSLYGARGGLMSLRRR